MSSDGEGPAMGSASPSKRRLSSGSAQSLTPKGSGNGSDNDDGSLGSDAGKADNNDDDDLFGSQSEGDDDKPAPRQLNDEELDSGDDEDRYDRMGDPMDYDQGDGVDYGGTLNVMDLDLGRVPEPESKDGEVHTLSIPNFLTIESEDFNPETYVAPPFSTAATSLCWRFDPNKESKIQSNSRVIRWSDGSLTLQLASTPQEQYRMPSKRLASKPKLGEYQRNLDTHTYLGAACESSSVFRITSHLTSSLAILPTTVETDDAVQRLQQSLAAATRGTKKNADGSVAMFDVKEDPELAKKQAEVAEREKLRAAKKRQMVAERDLDRGRRVGLSARSGGGGLTVGGLEDDEGMTTTKARSSNKAKRGANRRGEIYSDEDDGYDRRGRTREDEYDEDDGFLVGSDEEEELVDDEEEEEEEDEDEDAEGEPEEDDKPRKEARRERSSEDKVAPKDTKMGGTGSPPARKKNRYIVDDDEDE